MQGGVRVHLICQVGCVGAKAVHKGHQLPLLKQQPEMTGIVCQPSGKFLGRGSLRCRKTGRLHGGNGL